MIHLVFPVGPLQCNCSIIADESTHEAMVIDPGDNIDRILATLNQHGLTLKHIVITHAHIDHIGGAARLKSATSAPILMNQNDQALVNMLDVQASWLGMRPPEKTVIDSPLEDGAALSTGAVHSTIIHTPGHTEGSVCLYIRAESTLIAGDTLFAGSIGRTDLPGGSHKKIMASLQDRVLALPDETVVIPGHGPSTTIGEERESNPFPWANQYPKLTIRLTPSAKSASGVMSDRTR